jgi:hypothetical protein
MRAKQERVGSIKKFVVGVGASEKGRILGEMEVLLTGPMIKVQGDWTDEKKAEFMEAVDKSEVPPSHILGGESIGRISSPDCQHSPSTG